MSATAGASLNTVRSAAAGTMSSFCANFTPSATSCAQPWKPPAYIGPRRDCMCAIALCSVWPTSSGSTRKTPSTSTTRSTASSRSLTAPPSGRAAVGPTPRGPGTPADAPCDGSDPPHGRAASDSPGSLAPGQALAARAASTKSLRSGWPSKPSGSSSGTRCGWPSKVRPNISNVSRSCHEAPAKTPGHRREPRIRAGHPGAQQEVLAAVEGIQVDDDARRSPRRAGRQRTASRRR